MSISSEIARLSKNISDSLDAVSAKGVTVPSGSTSDDLAGLIAQITGGGGATVVTTPDSHGGDIVTITTSINLSGDTVAADKLLSGYTAHNSAGQAITGTYVPPTASLQAKTGIVPSTSSQTIEPDTGYDGLSSVQIDAIDTQTKSATPSESAQTITPDSGKYLTSVSVGAVSSTYVGSGIDRNDSTDLTASGATVSVPAGYYEEAASKSVASGSATTPATTITANPSISVDANGLITATASASKSVTPSVSAGYVSAGTAGTVSVSGSNTSQLDTQAAVTVTPSTTQQTVGGAGKYMLGAITVEAMPSGALSNPSISVNASGLITATSGVGTAGYLGTSATANNTSQLTTQAAQTIHPSTTDQTIASGRYLTGTQTVKAVTTTNLTASNILSGVTVKVGDSTDDDCVASVAGSVVIQHYYTGSSDPSASQGVDGDIYLKVVS